MSRKNITDKNVQVHFQCVCGSNVVYQASYPIPYKEFSKAGIVRRISKDTGKPFLLQKIHAKECHCHDDY